MTTSSGTTARLQDLESNVSLYSDSLSVHARPIINVPIPSFYHQLSVRSCTTTCAQFGSNISDSPFSSRRSDHHIRTKHQLRLDARCVYSIPQSRRSGMIPPVRLYSRPINDLRKVTPYLSLPFCFQDVLLLLQFLIHVLPSHLGKTKRCSWAALCVNHPTSITPTS